MNTVFKVKRFPAPRRLSRWSPLQLRNKFPDYIISRSHQIEERKHRESEISVNSSWCPKHEPLKDSGDLEDDNPDRKPPLTSAPGGKALFLISGLQRLMGKTTPKSHSLIS